MKKNYITPTVQNLGLNIAKILEDSPLEFHNETGDTDVQGTKKRFPFLDDDDDWE